MCMALELFILGLTLSEYEIEILFVALGIDCATRNNDVQLLNNLRRNMSIPLAKGSL